MRLFVPAETREGERRVALVPDTVPKLVALGLEVCVESGAGVEAYASDEDYLKAGANVIATADVPNVLAEADVIATVRPMDPPAAATLKDGAVVLSFLQPRVDTDYIAAIAKSKATALSFDLVPRISRAQSMDALSSQALVTGYRCTLIAADLLPKFLPLFMTAAGTIPPAKVLVLGAGVAGLQAIATAKRLGSLVSAYDVRSASADEVRSLGGTFVELELETLEAGGGYAKEMTEDRAARQRELLTPYITKSDILITTAAVPGRAAPRLVTAEMISGMRAGSVIVDMAAESGGNVEGSVPGETVDVNGVLIFGAKDLASTMPVHASKLYSMNVLALLGLAVKDGENTLDIEDEVFDGCAVVYNGEIRKGA
ncbi:MAG: Re/Si-specific NAD(P)(+) transhydrogenase subunit alpha [Actinomycetes bacterium]